jgi:hypothetical protein
LAIPAGISDEQRHEPRMNADHAVDPGDRHVALAERHLHLEIGAHVHLVAAPAPRLQHLEQACGLHLGDSFGRDAALALALRGAHAQRRDHGARPRDDLVRARDFFGDVLLGQHCDYFSSSTVLNFAGITISSTSQPSE